MHTTPRADCSSFHSHGVLNKTQDFKRSFGQEFGYEIKRGEQTYGDWVITNEDAAKVLLAFDLEQPWACHQSYRLFDDLHSDIFGRPEVSAERIVGLIAVRDAVATSLENLDNQLAAYYSVTPYFVMYLVNRPCSLIRWVKSSARILAVLCRRGDSMQWSRQCARSLMT
jgi:hypothetical protein